MGARGPKPQPKKVHELKGNPGKRNLARMAGETVPVEVPPCPEHVEANKVAAAEWKSITGELFRLGLISKVDKAALAVYCLAYARWVRAEKKLAELDDDGLIQTTPNGYQQIGVWVQISNRQVELMHKMMAEFGMTPSARVRVDVNPQMDMFGNGEKDEDKKSGGSKKASPKATYLS